MDETPLYSDEEGEYEFYSVDRDGNKLKDACGDSDFHFVRFDISAEDEMEILDLLLNCLIDEETNETAVLYSYISTKDDGISASMMNLPSAAMTFIPLYSPYVSAALGAAPRPFDPLAWFLGGLITFILIVLFGPGILLVTTIIIIVVITTQNNENAESIGMTILTWLAHLVWLLVRAAILILAYVLFALFLVASLLIYCILIPIALVLSLFSDDEPEISFLFISFIFLGKEIEYQSVIQFKYIEYFDIEIPVISTEFKISGNPVIHFSSDFIFGNADEAKLKSEKAVTELKIDPSLIIQDISGEIDSLKSSSTTSALNREALANGYNTAAIIVMISTALIIMAKMFKKYALAFVLTSIAFALIFILCETIRLGNSADTDSYSFCYQIGLGLGLLQAAIYLAIMRTSKLLTIEKTEKIDQLIPVAIDVIQYIFHQIGENYRLEPEYEDIKEFLTMPRLIVSQLVIFASTLICSGIIYGKARTASPEEDAGYMGLTVIFFIFGLANTLSGFSKLINNY